MIFAVDTNILVKAFQEGEPDHRAVTVFIERTGKVCHDHGRVISGEYEKHVGTVIGYRKWYQRLQQRQAIYYCDTHIPERHRSKLFKLGCHEPPDHVFIGVAYNSDRVLVSEDSDIGKGSKGHQFPYCDVLDYLTNEMNLDICDAAEFCSRYWPEDQAMQKRGLSW